MSLNIQQKLFFLLSGITILVLVVVLFAVNSTASNTIREDVIADFKQTQGFFQIEQSLRYDRLVESAYLIQENSTFKANMELNDPPSMQIVVDEQYAPFIKADLFVVTNSEGSVLAWLNQPEKANINLAETRSTVQTALTGEEPPLNITWPDLWAVEGELYQVVTIPAFTSRSITAPILGTITLGTRLTSADAEELMQNTPLGVTFFLNDNAIASSGERQDEESYNEFLNDNESLVNSSIDSLTISEPFTYEWNGVDHYNFVSPLGKGESAFYIASVPTSTELAILSKMQRNILIIAAIAFLIIIPLAIFLGRILSQPVNRLTHAMAKVEKGEFDVSVTPSTNDEIGHMTRSFNNMVDGLRERFALQKYVGAHTLSMIKDTSDQEAQLGGQNTELAILFSDIRDSTKTIESNSPEVFVQQLNRLLSFQSKIVQSNNGSIDKYVGDSVIALFDGSDAFDRAIQCAVDIQENFKKEFGGQKSIFTGVGIGVNYGSVVLGNMGGENRMDYTVIGPEVNLCARLCDAAASGQILIPEYLSKNITLKKGITTSEPMNKELKGFSEKVKVTEISYE